MAITWEDLQNLDALSVSQLNEAKEVLWMLENYAGGRLSAMEHRLAGDVNNAKNMESFCEIFYKRLPDEFKW